MRNALTVLAIVASFLLSASPAWAGEEAAGSGWSFDLPDGFVEVMSMEGGSGFQFTSQMNGLPVEGVPEMKAYSHGGGNSAQGVIIVTKVGLSREVTSSSELGMKDIEKMREQLPIGASVTETSIDGRQAVEITFRDADSYEQKTVRLVAIACGKYVVVIMMISNDDDLPHAASMWSGMQSSIEINPPINKLLLFGLLAAGAIGAIYLLNRVGTRQVHDIPDHTGGWDRNPDGPGASGHAGTAPKIGVRPKTLPSSKPQFGGPAGAPPPLRGGGAMPARTATSAEVTRPANEAPPSRPGLRSTLPASGQWGK